MRTIRIVFLIALAFLILNLNCENVAQGQFKIIRNKNFPLNSKDKIQINNKLICAIKCFKTNDCKN